MAEQILNEIAGGPTENIRSQLNNHFFVGGKPTTLRDLVVERRDHLSRFRMILSQMSKMERG